MTWKLYGNKEYLTWKIYGNKEIYLEFNSLQDVAGSNGGDSCTSFLGIIGHEKVKDSVVEFAKCLNQISYAKETIHMGWKQGTGQ